MVTTHSESEWRLLRSLRNQGRADSGGWLEHARLGFNYRIDDMRAAIGLGQLEKLDDILAGAGRRRGALLASCSPTSPGSSSRARTTPTTSARGSSTSSRFRLDADREAVIASLTATRRSDGALSPVHPSPAVHAGALRISRRPVPRRRGAGVAHARAPVPRAARRGRPGVRRRRAPRSAGVVARGPSQGEALRHLGDLGALIAAVVSHVQPDRSERDVPRLPRRNRGRSQSCADARSTSRSRSSRSRSC